MNYPARNSDIGGSHEAASRIVSSGAQSAQKLRTEAAVRRHPGMTSMQLARATGMDRHMLGRRLPELAREGRIWRGPKAWCPISEINACTWWPVAPGQNYTLAV